MNAGRTFPIAIVMLVLIACWMCGQRTGSSQSAAQEGGKAAEQRPAAEIAVVDMASIFKQVADMGVGLLDAWVDNANRSVTVIVDQPGFLPTRFEVECQGSTWQVTIRADSDQDAERLLRESDQLHERFEEADLGKVVLVPSGKPDT